MSDPTQSPEAIAALVSAVKQLLGTIFVGFTIATTLYGITCLQVYLYYKHYPKDTWYSKAMVALLWALDTLATILEAHSIYTYTVLNLPNIALDVKIPWSFVLEKQIIDIITLIEQLYFVSQLFRLRTSRILCICILFLALLAYSLSIPLTVFLFADLSVEVLASRKVKIFGSLEPSVAALCDILITGGLIYYLKGWRSSGRGASMRTSVMIENLILYAVTRGTLTAICEIIFAVLVPTMPARTFWQPFHMSLGKLYVNSVLASLNFRVTEDTGAPAFPLGRRQPTSATLAASLASHEAAVRLPSQSFDPKLTFTEGRHAMVSITKVQASDMDHTFEQTTDMKETGYDL